MKSPEVSVSDIQAILETEWEGDLPDQVLAVFQKEDGKMFSKRLLAKLPGGENAWYISHSANMTKIETRDYSRSGGNAGYSFLVSYDTKNVVINPGSLQELNTCYFSARIERNKLRLAAKNSPLDLDEMARVINQVRTAKAALAEAEAKLEKLVSYGEMFSPDQYTWKRLAEGEKEKGR